MSLKEREIQVLQPTMFSKDEEVQRIRNDNENKFDATVERLKVYYSMG